MRLRGMLALALGYPVTPMVKGVPKVRSLAFWDRMTVDICRALDGLDCLYVTDKGNPGGKVHKRACKACDTRKRGLCSRHSPVKKGRGYRADLHEDGKGQKGRTRTYHVGAE